MIDRSGTVSFSLAVYVTITIRLLFDSGLIRLFNDHVNSNMVFLLDNKIYLIMRNQITHLVFVHNTLPACTPINLIYIGPLCYVRFSDHLISGVPELIRSCERAHR